MPRLVDDPPSGSTAALVGSRHFRWDNHSLKFDEPRPLSLAELAILNALLASDFLGAAELRAQLPAVTVVGNCDCGCPSVDLVVPTDVAPSPVQTRARLAPI